METTEFDKLKLIVIDDLRGLEKLKKSLFKVLDVCEKEQDEIDKLVKQKAMTEEEGEHEKTLIYARAKQKLNEFGEIKEKLIK